MAKSNKSNKKSMTNKEGLTPGQKEEWEKFKVSDAGAAKQLRKTEKREFKEDEYEKATRLAKEKAKIELARKRTEELEKKKPVEIQEGEVLSIIGDIDRFTNSLNNLLKKERGTGKIRKLYQESEEDLARNENREKCERVKESLVSLREQYREAMKLTLKERPGLISPQIRKEFEDFERKFTKPEEEEKEFQMARVVPVWEQYNTLRKMRGSYDDKMEKNREEEIVRSVLGK